MMIKASFFGLPEVFRLTIPAEGDQQDLPGLGQFAQTPCDFISIHDRQANIKNNDLWFKCLCCLNAGRVRPVRTEPDAPAAPAASVWSEPRQRYHLR